MSAAGERCPRCRYEIGILGAPTCPECGLSVVWTPIGQNRIRFGPRWIVLLLLSLALVDCAAIVSSMAVVAMQQESDRSGGAASQAEQELLAYSFRVLNWRMQIRNDPSAPAPEPKRPSPRPARPGFLSRTKAVVAHYPVEFGLQAAAAATVFAAAVVVAVAPRRDLSRRRQRDVRATLVTALAATGMIVWSAITLAIFVL